MIARAGRVLRAALPVLLVIALTAAVIPATAPSPPVSALSAYLPTNLRHDQISALPAGEVWESNQATLPARAAFAELPGNVAHALGYDDRADAPELQGQWLLVDLVPPGGDGSLQTLAFHVGVRRVTLQAILTPRSWTTYVPGLPVLDADVLTGGTLTWSGTITRSVGGAKPAGSRGAGTVVAAPATDPACVDTTIRVGSADRPAVGRPSTRMSRWCRGAEAGWAADVIDGRGAARTSAPPAQHPAPQLSDDVAPPRTLTGRVAPVDHYRLVSEFLTKTTVNHPRLVARAGSAVVSAGSDGRIEAWSPVGKPAPGVTDDYLRWRALPAGRATALTAVGDVTIAADTAHRVTAWASDGRQLWQQSAGDLVSSLTPAGGDVVVGEADGRLRLLDAATGAQRWSRDLGAQASVAASSEAVVALADGSLTVLDPRTGSLRWDRTLGGTAHFAAFGDLVVIKVGTWLVARSADTGSVIWWQSVEGAAESMTANDRQLVLLGAAATTTFGPDGRVRWSTAPAQLVRQAGDQVTLTYADHVELWDATGRRRTWPYPPGYGASVDFVVLTAGGLRLFQPSDEGGRWWEYR